MTYAVDYIQMLSDLGFQIYDSYLTNWEWLWTPLFTIGEGLNLVGSPYPVLQLLGNFLPLDVNLIGLLLTGLVVVLILKAVSVLPVV